MLQILGRCALVSTRSLGEKLRTHVRRMRSSYAGLQSPKHKPEVGGSNATFEAEKERIRATRQSANDAERNRLIRQRTDELKSIGVSPKEAERTAQEDWHAGRLYGNLRRLEHERSVPRGPTVRGGSGGSRSKSRRKEAPKRPRGRPEKHDDEKLSKCFDARVPSRYWKFAKGCKKNGLPFYRILEFLFDSPEALAGELSRWVENATYLPTPADGGGEHWLSTRPSERKPNQIVFGDLHERIPAALASRVKQLLDSTDQAQRAKYLASENDEYEEEYHKYFDRERHLRFFRKRHQNLLRKAKPADVARMALDIYLEYCYRANPNRSVRLSDLEEWKELRRLFHNVTA
jgi:hypothetical protein